MPNIVNDIPDWMPPLIEELQALGFVPLTPAYIEAIPPCTAGVAEIDGPTQTRKHSGKAYNLRRELASVMDRHPGALVRHIATRWEQAESLRSAMDELYGLKHTRKGTLKHAPASHRPIEHAKWLQGVLPV